MHTDAEDDSETTITHNSEKARLIQGDDAAPDYALVRGFVQVLENSGSFISFYAI